MDEELTYSDLVRIKVWYNFFNARNYTNTNDLAAIDKLKKMREEMIKNATELDLDAQCWGFEPREKSLKK